MVSNFLIHCCKLLTMANELATWIINELNKRSWSQRELARRSGLSHAQISNVISGNRKITWDFCAAIADGFGVSPIKIFSLAGKLPSLSEAEGDLTFQELTEFAKQLAPEEREELLEYALFRFRRQKERSSAPEEENES